MGGNTERVRVSEGTASDGPSNGRPEALEEEEGRRRGGREKRDDDGRKEEGDNDNYDDDCDDDDEDDDDGEDEDEGYRLLFDGEVDPLDFVQDGTQGVEFYRQFEMLEYEALAERKRKTLNQQSRDEPAKKPRKDEYFGVTVDEINEMMNFGVRKRSRSRAPKKRGRRKGSKNNLSPEVTRKIGDATLHYASGNYRDAIPLLEEVVRLAPNLSDSYYILGLMYDAMGNRKKAMSFHMIAAHLTPKDPSLWKKLIAWSIEQGKTGQVRYCLSKAITADPKDLGLRFDRALLHAELGEYHKAAESYEQILGLYPANADACTMAVKMYQKCGQVERAISILEDYVNGHSGEADLSVLGLLIDLLMDTNAHSKALKRIEHASSAYGSKMKLPPYLKAKAAICHVHLGSLENAEVLLHDMLLHHAEDNLELIMETADSFAKLSHYDYALKFYDMLEGLACHDNMRRVQGSLHLKMAQCYASKKERGKAIPYFYKALLSMHDNIDARITLSSLLVEEGKQNEAIILLSPPKDSVENPHLNSTQLKPWWRSGKIHLQLAKIYRSEGMLEGFVEALFSLVYETLVIEAKNWKAKARKRLTTSVLFERIKLLDDQQGDNVFHGFKPIATSSELLKATRAKKSLQKKEALREEKKTAALAAGVDWQSEDSEDEAPRKGKIEPPLPGLLKDEEHHQLIVDLCKALASLQRFWEAFEIIYLTLKVENNKISVEKKDELRSLGAQIAYKTTDPKHGYDHARYIVQQHPKSIAAWNCYYKVILRFENRFSRHLKFLYGMRVKHGDVVPPMIISGHQFATHSQHQAAAREYLEAFKLQPENPLINLCVGTTLINLAFGFRLHNKHQCVAQGFAFLYNYLHICKNSQEALYNIARAHHHVGLITLAAAYYEKVLSIRVKDHLVPKLPNEDPNFREDRKPVSCDLQREAAYNLHLIYKKSGAVDLARQVLKDYCTI